MQVDVFFIFATVAFFIWSIRSIIYFVNGWQRFLSNGLRRNVSLAYVTSFLFSPLSLLTWLALFSAILLTFSDLSQIYIKYTVLALFFIKAGVVISDISRNKIRRPKFTPQTILIICLSLIFTAIAFSFPFSERYLWLLLLDRMLFMFVCIPIFLVLFPTEIVDDLRIRSSLKNLKRYRKLKTILLVGDDADEVSYFLEQFLSKNKDVVRVDTASSLSQICRVIQREVTDQTDYLLVPHKNTNYPQLEGIVREIHFSTIIFTKSLKPEKLFNLLQPFISLHTKLVADTVFPIKFTGKKQRTVLTYSSTSQNNVMLTVTSLQQRKTKLSFSILYKDEKLQFTAPLIGTHHLEYILPGLLFVLAEGMKSERVLSLCEKLIPLSGEFVEHRLQSGTVVVDATAASDVHILKSGLSLLKLYRKQRVIVFALESELTQKEVKELTTELSFGTSVLVLGGKYQVLLRKLLRVGSDKVEVRSIEANTVPRFIRDRLGNDDVIVFLGENASPIVERVLLASSTS